MSDMTNLDKIKAEARAIFPSPDSGKVEELINRAAQATRERDIEVVENEPIRVGFLVTMKSGELKAYRKAIAQTLRNL